MTDNKDIIVLDEKKPTTEPKVSDKTVEEFMKNTDKYKGRNREILIKLGIVKPDMEEKLYLDKPSWYNRFKNYDYNNNTNNHNVKKIDV